MSRPQPNNQFIDDDEPLGNAYGGSYGPDYDPAYEENYDGHEGHEGNDDTNASASLSEAREPARAGHSGAGVGDGMSAVERDDARGIKEHEGLMGRVVTVLRNIFDPEIPVNIYDLGLIYEVQEQAGGAVRITMTLTSPMCPVAGSLPPEVKRRVEVEANVEDVSVDIVWDPPWTPHKMSEAARLQLNFF